MGKRFGRNQRRALRERLQELELVAYRRAVAATRLAVDGKAVEDRARRAESKLDALKMALGDRFVGFDPKRYEEVDGLAIACGSRGLPEPFGIAVLGDVLECHALYQDTHVDKLRDQIHFYVRLAGSGVAYAISAAAIRSAPPEVLAANIARELTRDLTDDITRMVCPSGRRRR